MRLDLNANDSPPIYTLQDAGKMKCVSASSRIRDVDRFCCMGLEFLFGLHQGGKKCKKKQRWIDIPMQLHLNKVNYF